VDGTIAGSVASGIFDPATCTRLRCEREACSPSTVAELALSCGADPRALADDGLSPYTAALFGKDPCGLLRDLDSGLQVKMLRGDPVSWAEAGRGRHGAGQMDLVAAPLTRGLLVPDELAEGLLEYCFSAHLPLLAFRVLSRIDGQRHLLTAMERAGNIHWLRVAEKILRQTCTDYPCWCGNETLEYAISQMQQGHRHFRLLLDECLVRLRGEDNFFSYPAALVGSAGAECPICFEPLHRGQPMAFTDDDGRAVCPHFVCSTCAKGYEASANSTGATRKCPECRRTAPRVLPLPKLADDPLGWFDFLTADSGAVSRSTLLRAISAMLPIDAEELGTAVDEGSVTSGPMRHEVTAAEFLTCGLYAWVWRHDLEHRRCGSLGPLPDISDRKAWFQHWNLAQTGTLSRGEVLRAILKTFGVSSMDRARVQELRGKLGRVWENWVSEQKRQHGFCSADGVLEAEFVRDAGLGDLLDEAFGFERGKASPHSPAPAEILSGDSLENCAFGPLRTVKLGATAAPRRERIVADRATAILSRHTLEAAVPGSTSARVGGGDIGRGGRESAPASEHNIAVPSSSMPASYAAAGVLGLLDEADAQELPQSVGGCTSEVRQAVGNYVQQAFGDNCLPPLPRSHLDAMEALEGLERDLGLSLRPHIISL